MVKVGVIVAVGVRVIVPEGEAVPTGVGGAVTVAVRFGAASTAPPQAVNIKVIPKKKRSDFFITDWFSW
jgi:hypothetical protein